MTVQNKKGQSTAYRTVNATREPSPTAPYTFGCCGYFIFTSFLISQFGMGGFQFAIKLFVVLVVIIVLCLMLTRKDRALKKVRKLIEGTKENLLKDFDQMKGDEFEKACAAILYANGYRNVSTTPASGDNGVDIFCEDGKYRYAVQCKRYASNVGNSAVQEVDSGCRYYDRDKAMVMTNSYFTRQAIELARKNGVALIDRDELFTMCNTQNRGKSLAETQEIAKAYEELFRKIYHLRIKVPRWTTVFSKLNIVLYLTGRGEKLEKYTQQLADRIGVCHELVYDENGWSLHITRD